MAGLGLQRKERGSLLGTMTNMKISLKVTMFDFICNLYAHAGLVSRQNASFNQPLIIPHLLEMPKSVYILRVLIVLFSKSDSILKHDH